MKVTALTISLLSVSGVIALPHYIDHSARGLAINDGTLQDKRSAPEDSAFLQPLTRRGKDKVVVKPGMPGIDSVSGLGNTHANSPVASRPVNMGAVNNALNANSKPRPQPQGPNTPPKTSKRGKDKVVVKPGMPGIDSVSGLGNTHANSPVASRPVNMGAVNNALNANSKPRPQPQGPNTPPKTSKRGKDKVVVKPGMPGIDSVSGLGNTHANSPVASRPVNMGAVNNALNANSKPRPQPQGPNTPPKSG